MRDSFKASISHFTRRMGYEVKRWRNPPKEQVDRQDPLLAAGELFRRQNMTPRVVFDVGANKGDFCDGALNLFPQATVFCFEPTHDVFSGLQRRFDGNARVRCFQQAVTETDGPVTFHIRAGSVWNSMLPNGQSGIAPETTLKVEVPGLSLDSFARRENVDHVDLLKFDIQGAEMMAIRGSRELLSTGRVGLIMLEVNFQQIYEGQADLETLSSTLFKHGYWLQGIYQASHSSGLLLSADVIFAHSRFLR